MWDESDLALARIAIQRLRRSPETRVLARALASIARIMKSQPRARVLRVLKRHPEGLTARDVQRLTHLRKREVYGVLELLESEGVIEARERRGRRGPPTLVFRLRENLSQKVEKT